MNRRVLKIFKRQRESIRDTNKKAFKRRQTDKSIIYALVAVTTAVLFVLFISQIVVITALVKHAWDYSFGP